MKTSHIVGLILLALIGIIAVTWIAQGNDFVLYKVFAPKYEDVRRTTFENTKSYRQGMVQEIRNYQAQYVTATPEQKEALASIILHQVADFPEENMPPDVQQFIKMLRNERNKPNFGATGNN